MLKGRWRLLLVPIGVVVAAIFNGLVESSIEATLEEAQVNPSVLMALYAASSWLSANWLTLLGWVIAGTLAAILIWPIVDFGKLQEFLAAIARRGDPPIDGPVEVPLQPMFGYVGAGDNETSSTYSGQMAALRKTTPKNDEIWMQWKPVTNGLNVSIENVTKVPIKAPRLLFMDALWWSDKQQDYVQVDRFQSLEMLDHPQALYCETPETFRVLYANPGKLAITGFDPRDGQKGQTQETIRRTGLWRIDLRLEWNDDEALQVQRADRSLEFNWDGNSIPIPTNSLRAST